MGNLNHFLKPHKMIRNNSRSEIDQAPDLLSSSQSLKIPIRLSSRRYKERNTPRPNSFFPKSNSMSDGRITPQMITRSFKHGDLRKTDHNTLTELKILQKPYCNVWGCYRKKKKISFGSYGKVYHCINRFTGAEVACKSIKKSMIRNMAGVEAVRTEVRALQTVQGHPCIITLIETFEDAKAVHLIMELCKGGELFDFIKENDGLSEENAAIICRQVASALSHCHSLGVVHRDVKPENIMLVSKNSIFDVRLIDFGTAGFHKPGTFMREFVGTPYYVAPEVLRCSYGRQVDMWSLGITTFALLTSSLPYSTHEQEKLFRLLEAGKLNLRGRKWVGVSEDGKDFVLGLLAHNPSERITAEQLRVHPWIQRHCSSLTLHPNFPAMYHN